MKKILIFILVFFSSIILFMPKINLYNTLEKFLKDERIIIKEEKISDNFISLNIEGATIFYDGIKSLEIGSLNVKPWLITNEIILTDIKPSAVIKKQLDVKADNVKINYSLWDYENVNIFAEGDFGELIGSFKVLTGKLHLVLNVSKKFSNNALVRQNFKKSEEGLVYEQIIKY